MSRFAGDFRPPAASGDVSELRGDFLGRRKLACLVRGEDLKDFVLGGATGVEASRSFLDLDAAVGCMKEGVPVLRRWVILLPSDIGVVLLGRS